MDSAIGANVEGAVLPAGDGQGSEGETEGRMGILLPSGIFVPWTGDMGSESDEDMGNDIPTGAKFSFASLFEEKGGKTVCPSELSSCESRGRGEMVVSVDSTLSDAWILPLPYEVSVTSISIEW